MKHFYLISILIISILLSTPTLADKDKKSKIPEYDLRGSWKVLLSNDLTRKQITLTFDEHEDGRVRGYMSSTGMETLKTDGRLKKNKFFTWGKFYERTGRSHEFEFRGKVQGEPGEERIVGKTEFFGKRYDFEAVRGEHEIKK